MPFYLFSSNFIVSILWYIMLSITIYGHFPICYTNLCFFGYSCPILTPMGESLCHLVRPHVKWNLTRKIKMFESFSCVFKKYCLSNHHFSFWKEEGYKYDDQRFHMFENRKKKLRNDFVWKLNFLRIQNRWNMLIFIFIIWYKQTTQCSLQR